MCRLSNPLISIITVVKNQESYLEGCIKSVIEQTYKNIEYIIIDGGSSDHTLDIVKKYSNNITFWISEVDNGIADAMNKGIKYTTGKFILFLHADDYLIDLNCIKNIIDKLDEETDIFAFSILFEINHTKRYCHSSWHWGMFLKTKIFHQGALCKKQLFEKIGYFDTSFRIAMDYDFFLRCYLNNVKTKIFNDVLTVMRDTGISSKKDWKSLKTRFDEEKKIHFKNCNFWFKRVFYHIYWLFYIPYRYSYDYLKKLL